MLYPMVRKRNSPKLNLVLTFIIRRSLDDPEIQDDGKRWFWEPGEGVLDFKGLYALLKKHQYKGWMTLETDGSPDYLASMALSRYYIDTVLKPIYD